jgi:hypothetical protein
VARISKRSKKSSRSSGFPSNIVGAPFELRTGIAANPVWTVIVGITCGAAILISNWLLDLIGNERSGEFGKEVLYGD